MIRTCTEPACGRPHKGRGLCDMHIQRLRRTGTTANPVRTLAERFWTKVDKSGPVVRPELGRCWVWTAATTDLGYGVMRPEGQRSGPAAKAHRVSAQLAGMDIEGRKVRHRCDNPPCVNPAHLLPGTQADNAADMADRDRSCHGSRNANARLNESEVSVIKRLALDGVQHRAIAEQFHVSRPTVSLIAEGKTWRRVPAVTPPAARDLVSAVVQALTGEDVAA